MTRCGRTLLTSCLGGAFGGLGITAGSLENVDGSRDLPPSRFPDVVICGVPIDRTTDRNPPAWHQMIEPVRAGHAASHGVSRVSYGLG